MPSGPTNFVGVGRTLGGSEVQPKGVKAQRQTDEAEYRPYHEAGKNDGASDQGVDDNDEDEEAAVKEIMDDDNDEDEEAAMKEIMDECKEFWSGDSDDETPEVKEKRQRQDERLERRYKKCMKSEVFKEYLDTNTKNRRFRFGAIITNYSRQLKYDPIIDASDKHIGHKDPDGKYVYVPCLNGSYKSRSDGQYHRI